jgi:transcriptional regulator GlxA family with amidase domain
MTRDTDSSLRDGRNPAATPDTPLRIGFLLLDNFTLIAQASAIEPLRMANQLLGSELYQWFTLSEDGGPVSASDGITVMPDASIHDPLPLDMVLVCGGISPHLSIKASHLDFLQQQARKRRKLGGVCTGPWALAQAGLLDGCKASIHWENASGLQEAFPRVQVTDRLFTIDRDRLTSSGGTAPLDMMLYLIGQQHGRELMAAISEMFMCDRLRGEHEQQRVPLKHLLGTGQPKLVEIVTLMEANIEEPLDIEDLARFANLSRRQVERLFLQYMHCSPSRHYLMIRLNRARQLLRQTSMMIIDVATACGFVSTPHFSKCYRAVFDISPRTERANGVVVAPKSRPAGGQQPRGEARHAHTPLASSAQAALRLAQGEITFGSVSRRARPEQGQGSA